MTQTQFYSPPGQILTQFVRLTVQSHKICTVENRPTLFRIFYYKTHVKYKKILIHLSVGYGIAAYAYSHKEDELESNASYAYDEFEAYDCNTAYESIMGG